MNWRDEEKWEHLSQNVFCAERFELARLALGLSWRKIQWLRSLFKFNHSMRDSNGNRVRHREMLAENSSTPVPELFPIKEMKAWETKKLNLGEELPFNRDQSEPGGAEAAEVSSVDHTIMEAIRHAEQNLAGGMRTKGTAEDPHWIVIQGDGAGLSADKSGVRV